MWHNNANDTRSSYTVVLKNSILGFLLFKIDTCDLKMGLKMCHSYAGDSTPYTSEISLGLVLEKLENSTNGLKQIT